MKFAKLVNYETKIEFIKFRKVKIKVRAINQRSTRFTSKVGNIIYGGTVREVLRLQRGAVNKRERIHDKSTEA